MKGWSKSILTALSILMLVFLITPASALAVVDKGNERGTTFSNAPVSPLVLSGWGWCLEYKEIGDVSLNLQGNMIPRAGDPEISDLYLTGTLEFIISDRTDTFDLELRGTKVRSLFFLKEVEGGDEPLIAEFEGSWLEETNYVACEGRIAITTPNHLAKPYFFVLRTPGVDVPAREHGGWVEDVEFLIQQGVGHFDRLADELCGEVEIKELLGTVLTQVAVIFREVRGLLGAYIP